MKALVKSRAEPGLWLQEVERPTLQPNEVLVKVQRASICGTDLHIYQWDTWAQKNVRTPTTLGHEFMGTIAEVGSRVDNWSVGDRVVIEGHVTCGQCRACQTGERYLCPQTLGTGVHRNGGFAEYAAMPQENLFWLPPSIPESIGSLLDPFGNAVHTALAFPIAGEDVLITGAGPVGLMAAAVARHCGARHVVITDINEDRLQTARSMGASMAINVNKVDLGEALAAEKIRDGFAVGLEMSGSPSALRQLLEHVRPGGGVALLGILPPDTAIDWNRVIFRGLNLKGIYGRKIFGTWYQSIALLESGLNLKPIITHELPLEKWEQGMKAMAAGLANKVVLTI